MRSRMLIPTGILLGLSCNAFGQAATMACKDESGRDGSCELNSRLNASVRIGLVFQDTDGSDGDLSISNFGSRLRWGGETELDNGLTGIGYLEFGINPDENGRPSDSDGDGQLDGPGSGVDRTRQLWVGLRGGFGDVKIGAQYTAFYDMISSHTDIAYWGSCWTQFECGRDTRALKYEGGSGDLSYAASITADPDDVDNDPVEDLEGGVNYAIGDYTVGVAATFRTDEGDADEGGVLFGAVGKGKIGDAGLAVGLQVADEDFANADDTVTNLTFAGSYGSGYVVANVGDNGDNSPFFATLGYAQSMSPASTIYYEAQVVDADDGSDETIIGRAVYIYNFDSAVLQPMDN